MPVSLEQMLSEPYYLFYSLEHNGTAQSALKFLKENHYSSLFTSQDMKAISSYNGENETTTFNKNEIADLKNVIIFKFRVVNFSRPYIDDDQLGYPICYIDENKNQHIIKSQRTKAYYLEIGKALLSIIFMIGYPLLSALIPAVPIGIAVAALAGVFGFMPKLMGIWLSLTTYVDPHPRVITQINNISRCAGVVLSIGPAVSILYTSIAALLLSFTPAALLGFVMGIVLAGVIIYDVAKVLSYGNWPYYDQEEVVKRAMTSYQINDVINGSSSEPIEAQSKLAQHSSSINSNPSSTNPGNLPSAVFNHKVVLPHQEPEGKPIASIILNPSQSLNFSAISR